jgi:hypothetical protein
MLEDRHLVVGLVLAPVVLALALHPSRRVPPGPVVLALETRPSPHPKGENRSTSAAIPDPETYWPSSLAKDTRVTRSDSGSKSTQRL